MCGAKPGLRVTFDVVDVPQKAGPGSPVSVMLAVRSGEQIQTGEVSIPRKRWDLAAFLSVIEGSSKLPS